MATPTAELARVSSEVEAAVEDQLHELGVRTVGRLGRLPAT
jgi:hypothetical protein